MATRSVEIGPTGRRVAANLATHRKRVGLDQRELARRVTEDLGRPMTASIISKIEKGDRRVDIDDLVALAAALGVSPVTLMLPAADSGEPVPITPGRSVSWPDAWHWMHGVAPLVSPGAREGSGATLQWFAINQPYLKFRRPLRRSTLVSESSEAWLEQSEYSEGDDDG